MPKSDDLLCKLEESWDLEKAPLLPMEIFQTPPTEGPTMQRASGLRCFALAFAAFALAGKPLFFSVFKPKPFNSLGTIAASKS